MTLRRTTAPRTGQDNRFRFTSRPGAQQSGRQSAPFVFDNRELPPRKGMHMTRRLMFLSLGVGALLVSAHHAAAQTARNCGQREAIVQRLAEGYGESRQSIGLGTENRVVETYANPDTGSWTITVTMPNGTMCLMASGHAFEAVEEALTPTGSPI